MTWEYVAGFFDGEGSIVIRLSQGGLECVVCSISQSVKQDHVLTLIGEFLAEQGILIGWSIQKAHKGSPCRMLRISTKEQHVRSFIDGVLPHLIVKRESAMEALRWFQLRSELRPLHGVHWKKAVPA